MSEPSIAEIANDAWLDYEPDWIRTKPAGAYRNEFDFEELEETFIDAFILGAAFFITKGK